MSAAVELEGVSADYGAIPALRDLTLAVAEGGRTALLGPNGAGKSTVLRVLTGLQPARGRVRLFGRDPRTIPAAERATLVAVVPQEVVVPMAFTVGQIVLMGRTATLGRWAGPTAADRRAAEEAMAYADVLELRDRLYDELSGGERQRAVLAMALAREPRLLLLDEPTAHLDLSHRLEILQRIERLNAERGVTVLMASHDLALAAGFFGQLALLDHGRVAACGPPGEVLREEILREVYHCELRVALDADGGWTVRPARRPGAARRSGPRVHVVAGGGSGAEALRRLALEGLPVTVGVLNEGDSDAAAAAALGMEAALERPFSPLGAAALGRGRALAAAADAVVVCEVPFGPGNVANLDLAAGALARGAAVFVHDRDPDARDYTADGAARRALRELLARGAVPWRHADDLVARLNRTPLA